MATLQNLVEGNVPRSLRQTRDYSGHRGWIDLTNKLLKRFARMQIWDKTLKKEVAVEVEDDYWITIPSDMKRLESIYYPPLRHYSEKDVRYSPSIVNGKIKLYEKFDKDETPHSFTLSGGTTSSIQINDDDANEDEWENWLLVPTDGTYQTPILIGEHSAASGGLTTLNFIHTQSNAIDSTAGYLTDLYLMVSYWAKWTELTAYTDEVPMSDEDEDLLGYALCMEATPITDKQGHSYFRDLFMEALEEKKDEVFTPTPDQLRPRPRPIAAFDDCEEFRNDDWEYIGDDTDD